jgi:ABC-2 type transport system ATP-binding protein
MEEKMQKKPVVQFKNIKKKIGKRMIIDDVTFDVNAGEVFGFLGPNGAGKTTTIRMLFGLISITEGEIFINGYSVRNDYEKAIAKVGGIVENPEMYKYLTGYQNLAQYARTYSGIAKERIDEVIELVGLDKRVHDKVKTYSLGMRQRLGLAQALLHKPSLIVLDEPTNGLDPAGIHELRNYLRHLAEKENIAVFVSSHLLAEMELMCDRVGIIQNGKLIDIQTINDFLAKDNAIRIMFTVDNVAKAKLCLENLFKPQELVIKQEGIEIMIESDQVPEIISALVHEGIRVFGIDKASKTLEDKFLEMTGGNGIA